MISKFCFGLTKWICIFCCAYSWVLFLVVLTYEVLDNHLRPRILALVYLVACLILFLVVLYGLYKEKLLYAGFFILVNLCLVIFGCFTWAVERPLSPDEKWYLFHFVVSLLVASNYTGKLVLNANHLLAGNGEEREMEVTAL